MKKSIVLFLIVSIFLCLSGCGRSQIKTNEDGLEYMGKTYALTSKHIFSHYSDLELNEGEDDLSFSLCKLEYTGEGKVQFIERKSKNNWYALDDHFLIQYDLSYYYMFSRVWLHTDTALTQPDFVPENISEIQECIGVPQFDGYDSSFEANSDEAAFTLEQHNGFEYSSKSISDKDFIERFVTEYKENLDVDSLIDEAKQTNDDIIKKAQAEYYEQTRLNENVTVYYKVCFKDADFPFKIIFTKLYEE